MRASKSETVKGTQGNVIFCEFGATGGDNGAGSDVDVIKRAIAEIDALSKDILSASLAMSQGEKENSRALLTVVGRLDNVAFQAGLVAGCATDDTGRALASAAADSRRLAAAGVAAAKWLRALVADQKGRVMAASQALQEVDEQIGALEELMHMCLEPVAAGVLKGESTN